MKSYNKTEIRKNISNNLKILRQRHEYTQADIGKIINKATTTVASWEQGDSAPDVATTYILSKLYEVSMEEICTSLPKYGQ